MNINRHLWLFIFTIFLFSCDSPAKRAFMDGCRNNNSTNSAECECYYNFIEKKIGKEKLEMLSTTNDVSNISHKDMEEIYNTMIESVAYCLKKLG